MEVQIIKNKSQHEKYLAEIERLIGLDPKPETPDANRLDLIATLVEKYEKENFPIDWPDPIEAVQFCMEEQTLRQKDLIPYIGSRSKVSEVLSRKRPLTLPMIRALNKGLGIPVDILLQEAENGEEGIEESGLGTTGIGKGVVYPLGHQLIPCGATSPGSRMRTSASGRSGPARASSPSNGGTWSPATPASCASSSASR